MCSPLICSFIQIAFFCPIFEETTVFPASGKDGLCNTVAPIGNSTDLTVITVYHQMEIKLTQAQLYAGALSRASDLVRAVYV